MQRVSTGIIGLDRLLRGGLPAGSMSLVLGTTGSGKSTLGKQVLFGALTKNRTAVLVDTYEPLQRAKEIMMSFEWDGELLAGMIFVDCYSWRTGIESGKYFGNPKNLTEFSIAVSDLLKKEIAPNSHARFVLDSFSDFIMHAGPESSQKFLESLKARLTERKVTSLVILEEGLHEQKTNAAIEYITDGTIRMKYEEGGRYLMVSRMLATPVTLKWIPFTLARGLELAVANYFR